MTSGIRPREGIHYDVPSETYRAWPCVNKSFLWDMLVSPAQARWNQSHPKDAAHYTVGSATDALMLKGGDAYFDRYFVDSTGTRRDKRTAKYQAVLAAAAGRPVLSPEKDELIRAMARAAEEDPEWNNWMEGGKTQVSIVWTDQETGLLCKARPDLVPTKPGALLDLKTAKDPRPRPFARDIRTYGYHVQAAFYSDGMSACTLEPYGRFWFAVAGKPERKKGEPLPPVGFAIYELAMAAVAKGRMQYRQLLQDYQRCMETDCWPAMPLRTPNVIDLPSWAYKQGDE